MTKDAIVTLLNNGVTDAQVRNNVTSRGVNFKATPADKNEIKGAGGSVALITLIDKSYNNPNQGSAGNNDTGGGGGTSVAASSNAPACVAISVLASLSTASTKPLLISLLASRRSLCSS